MICINREERKLAFTTDRAHHTTHQRLCSIEDSTPLVGRTSYPGPQVPTKASFCRLYSLSGWRFNQAF